MKVLYDECIKSLRDNKCTECNDFYQCSVCDYFQEQYNRGRVAGYSQAENDYHKQTEKDRKSSYDCGYAQGRADKYQEIVSECMLLTEKQVQEIRADAIDECIKTLAKSEDTILTDKQYYILQDLKEKNNEAITCFDCIHHFMSDCYLECNKHNRINNNQICKDFEELKEHNNG